MDEAEAKRAVRRRLLAPLRHSLKVAYDGESWMLDGDSLNVHAEPRPRGRRSARQRAARGGFPGRLVRYVTGGEVDENVPAGVTYSKAAVNRFVRRVADASTAKRRTPASNRAANRSRSTPAKYGRKLRDNLLTRRLRAAVLNAVGRPHDRRPHPPGEARSDREGSRRRVPVLPDARPRDFTLRLWEHLKLAKSYTVAVGQEGLETPEGLYHIQEKQVNPSWHVPNSAWAGDLAGQVIPPGPADPIKARWMGIYEGAGIHGTEETWSLGTAASHGCVRMSIPDVEELYDRVEVGTPIYIG